MKPFLAPLFALFIIAGCSSETETPKEEIPAAHPAVAVADEILTAIANGDAEGLQKHLSEVNRKKLTLEKIKKYLPEMNSDTGGVTGISELVKGRRFDKTGEVFGKIRVEGREVMGVSLTLEEGEYRFDGINSPSVKRYEELGKLWP
jgi:hypothetical protein